MSKLTPRQRQRLATMAEIVAAARDQLRMGEEPSVRSVSAAIGLSSQGLYRYVASIDELRVLVVRDILDSTLGYMGEARDRYTDPHHRIAGAAAGFRAWALANRQEFRMAFTYPLEPAVDLDTDVLNTPQRVGEFFAPLFIALREATGFTLPEQIDAAYLPIVEADSAKKHYLGLTGEGQAGMIWLFQYAWTRLFGIVALEVFGQLEEESVRSGIFFKVAMAELAERLGCSDMAGFMQVLELELARDAKESGS